MIKDYNITGIILAGGKSSRMGTDKGFMLFNKKPFIQYSIDALKPLTSEIFIVSDNTDYDKFGLKRINDIAKDLGPIAGIYSGLEASTTTYNLILSCDIPLINSEILTKLVYHIDNHSEIIQFESSGKTMPLIALYQKKCKNNFYKVLQTGEKRLSKAVNTCITKTIILKSENEIFTMNVNTKHELKIAEDVYKH